MAFELNEDQKAFMADPIRVRSLAEWVLREDNHMATKVRRIARIGVQTAPSEGTVRLITNILAGSDALTTSDLARLINAFRQTAKSA